jgi:MFS family permease
MKDIRQIKKQKFFYGWWVVMACSVVGLLSGSSRFSFTMFFPTLIDDLGWTRASLGFGLTLHMWVYAFTVIAAGYFVDKYGARVIMCLGGMIILLGLAFTSTMTHLWQFYIYYGVVLAVGVALTLAVPILGTVRKWFIKKAGIALALTHIGAGLGGVLMAVLIPGMIAGFGWRKSWLYLGLVLGTAIIAMAGIVIRKNPESMGLLPDGETTLTQEEPAASTSSSEAAQSVEEIWTVKDAMKTRSFWCFIVGGSISAIPAIGITGHIANWGMDIAKALDVPAADAMGYIKLSVSLSAVFSMVGAMFGGPLSDRFGRKSLILTGVGCNAAVFLFAAGIDSLFWYVTSASLMGFFGGLVGPAWGAYLGDIFGRYALATIFSFIIFSIGIVGGTGSVIFGWIRDSNHSYAWAWILSSICTAATFLLYTMTRKEVKNTEAGIQNSEFRI